MEILRLLREHRERECREQVKNDLRAETARRAEWAIVTTWTAVLHGDIDDIKQHLADEEAARSN